MSRTITVNGSVYVVKPGYPINWNIGQELDNAMITFETDTKTTIPRFSVATLSLDSAKEFKLLVSDVNYETTRIKVLHYVSLVEMTAILNYTTTNGLAVTNGPTLYAQLETLIAKINLANYEGATATDYLYKLELDITKDWTAFSSAGPEMFIFDKDKTAREILDEFMSALKLEVRVTNVYVSGGNLMITIGYDDPSVKNNDASDLLNIFQSKKEYRKEENIAKGIRSVVESGFGIDTIETPIIPLRSNEVGKYINDEVYFLTNYNIERIEHFYCKCWIDKYLTSDGGETWVYQTGGYDISPIGNLLLIDYFVVEKEYYDNLTDEQRKYLFYFSRNTRNIYGFYEELSKWGFSVYHIKYLNDYLISTGYAVYYEGVYKYVYNVYDGTHEPMFKLVYKPSGSAFYDELKETSVSSNYLRSARIIDNSAGINTDLNRYGKSLQNKINRLGNREMEITCNHLNGWSEVYDIGDYIDDFIIDSIKTSTLREKVLAWYHLTEFYTPLNEKTSLKKVAKTYDDGLKEAVDRHFVYFVNNASYNNAKGVLIKTHSSLTVDIMSDWVYIPLKKYHSENTNYAMAELEDSRGADYIKTSATVGGSTAHVIKKMSYTDNNGEALYISIKLVGDNYLESPEFNAETYPLESTYDDADIIYSNLKRVLRKDNYERIKLVFVNRS